MSADSDTDTDMAMELFRLRSECQRYEAERIKLEEEVRFWRIFYKESVRLFGDKSGTYEKMTEKAMKRLKGYCRYLASTPKKLQRQDWISNYENRALKNWSKTYEPELVAAAYDFYLANPDGVTREEAIQQVAKEFRFPTYGAAYDYLKGECKVNLPEYKIKLPWRKP